MANDAIRLPAGPRPDPRTFASGCAIGDVDVSPAGDDRYLIADPGGREIVFERDAFERLVSVEDALGRGHRVSYDEEGRIVTYGNTSGVEATFRYSPSGRLEQIDHADGTRTTYSFDAAQHRLSLTDDLAGSAHLEWDAHRRLTAAVTPRARRCTPTTVNGVTVSYRYPTDDDTLPNEIRFLGNVVGIEYHPSGVERLIALPNGVQIITDIDTLGRLTRTRYVRGPDVLHDYRLEYGAAGELVGVHGDSTIGQDPAQEFVRSDRTGQLTSVDGESVTSDPAGRVTVDGGFAYTWNARGQLAGITEADGTGHELSYDPFGRLAVIRSGGSESTVLSDGLELVGRDDGGMPCVTRRSPGRRLDHPPDPEAGSDTASADPPRQHELAAVPARPSVGGARGRLLPRRDRHTAADPRAVRLGGGIPLRAYPRRHRQPRRGVDHPTSPQPPAQPGRACGRVQLPGPGPGRPVHGSLRRGVRRRWHRRREDPRPQSPARTPTPRGSCSPPGPN